MDIHIQQSDFFAGKVQRHGQIDGNSAFTDASLAGEHNYLVLDSA